MKNIIRIAIVALAFTATEASGQEKPRERLEAYRIAFFTRKLNLTPDEAAKFWPLYNEYQMKKNQIQLEKVRINRDFNQNELNMTAKELSDMGDRFVALEMQSANLTQEYHRKFKEVLSPVKVLRLYQAENQYRLQLLQELKQNGQGRNGLKKEGAEQDEF